VPNLYQRLRAAGYAVASCGKSDLRKPCRSWGADGRHVVDGVSEWERLGFTHGADSAGKHDAVAALRAGVAEPYGAFLARHGLAAIHLADYAARPYPNYANVAPTALPDFAYADNVVGAQALALLRTLADQPPWFLQVNFSGPHEPMDVTAAMRASVAGRDMPVPAVDPALPVAAHREIRRNYAAMIEAIDRWVGHFLAVLESAGSLGRTVVIYASDHGEMLGEHDEWAKWVPWRPAIAVPLIVAGPGIPHHADGDPASLIDLAPTLLDLAGAPPLDGSDGRSLVARLAAPAGGAAGGDADALRVVGLGRWRAAVTRTHTLIVGYRPGMSHAAMLADDWSGACDSPLLFDRVRDPGETRDLAAAQPEIVRRLFDRLAAAAAGAHA
jgi:arylsulfatase A-like enzyme